MYMQQGSQGSLSSLKVLHSNVPSTTTTNNNKNIKNVQEKFLVLVVSKYIYELYFLKIIGMKYFSTDNCYNYFQWNYPQLNGTWPKRWLVNIGLGNDSVLSDSKTFIQPMVTKMSQDQNLTIFGWIGAIYWRSLTKIKTSIWISNYISYFLWYVITHPYHICRFPIS